MGKTISRNEKMDKIGKDRQKIIDDYNKQAKHQQDLVQGWWGNCRCIPAGTHGSTPHVLKTVKKWRKSEYDKQQNKAGLNAECQE